MALWEMQQYHEALVVHSEKNLRPIPAVQMATFVA